MGKNLTTEKKSAYESVANIRDRVIRSLVLAEAAPEEAHGWSRQYKHVHTKIAVLVPDYFIISFVIVARQSQ